MPYDSSEKAKATKHAYYLAHRQEILAAKKAYGDAHRDEIRVKHHGHYAQNRERVKAHARDYYHAHKKECAIRAKAYRTTHQEACRTRNKVYAAAHRKERRAYLLRRSYGISQAEYDALMNRHGGRCWICKTDDFGWKGPCVDHDHITNQVRGILCNTCNRAAGLLKENIFTMKAMIDYFRQANTYLEEDMPKGLHKIILEQQEMVQ
jgi:prolyl-tRNA synthetase